MRLKEMLLFAAFVSGAVVTQEAACATGGESYPTSEAIKSIPRPTLGKRWTLIEELSDEFNGKRLDQSKWYDYHPSWQGRPPGLFMSEQVSVKDGCLVLEAGKLKPGEEVTVKTGYMGNERTKSFTAVDEFVEGTPGAFNVKCAAVVAKSITAHYDTYYECKVKANKTILSTTFWLSQHGKNIATSEGRQASGWSGSYGQELDILECVGRTGDFAGNEFSKGMHSNAHLWFREEGVNKTADLRAKSVVLKREDGAMLCDDFNVYGCWWVDQSSAIFYLNNEQSKAMDFKVNIAPKGSEQHKGKEFYFSEPMGLNLVMETYTWFYETPPGKNGWNDRIQNEDGSYRLILPTDEEVTNPEKNKNYYDWVRCYKLKGIDEKTPGRADYVMFENHIHIYDKPSALSVKDGALSVELEYTASRDSEIEFSIYDAKGKEVSTQVVGALAGYANNSYKLSTKGVKLSSGGKYHLVARLRPAKSKNNSSAYEGDSFGFTFEK